MASSNENRGAVRVPNTFYKAAGLCGGCQRGGWPGEGAPNFALGPKSPRPPGLKPCRQLGSAFLPTRPPGGSRRPLVPGPRRLQPPAAGAATLLEGTCCSSQTDEARSCPSLGGHGGSRSPPAPPHTAVCVGPVGDLQPPPPGARMSVRGDWLTPTPHTPRRGKPTAVSEEDRLRRGIRSRQANPLHGLTRVCSHVKGRASREGADSAFPGPLRGAAWGHHRFSFRNTRPSKLLLWAGLNSGIRRPKGILWEAEP